MWYLHDGFITWQIKYNIIIKSWSPDTKPNIHLNAFFVWMNMDQGRYYIPCKTSIFSSPVLLLCVHTRYNPFAHPSCSYYYLLSPSILFLHILLFCTFYSIAHFTLISLFYHIYALVLCYFYIIFIVILLHCPLSGPDLIYISLLIIPCIIYYVTNKETLNLEPSMRLLNLTDAKSKGNDAEKVSILLNTSYLWFKYDLSPHVLLTLN